MTEQGLRRVRLGGSGTGPGMTSGESPAEWPGGTGVPGPFGNHPAMGGRLRRHMSPAPLARVAPCRECEQGARRRAAVFGSTNSKSAAGTRDQPQAESRPAGGVSTGEGGHSRRQAGSCYCEPVRGVVPDGIGPSKGRPKAPASQPEQASLAATACASWPPASMPVTTPAQVLPGLPA